MTTILLGHRGRRTWRPCIFSSPQTALLFVMFLITAATATAAPTDATALSLSSNAQQIFQASMHWGDQLWDPQSHLLRLPAIQSAHTERDRSPLLVRESSWYALGLLLRDHPGDRNRAETILRIILSQQYHAPGKPWDGTFRRSPAEPTPPEHAVMWKDYDPNWREFIGTTFAIILEEFPDRIAPDLAQELRKSIIDAVGGELNNKRLVPTYTNPALMFGFLWDYAAAQGHNSSWMQQSQQWQETIYQLYKKHHAFYEYNSPTYSGVDLYALRLWVRYGSTAHMRSMGSRMEAGLWEDLAAFYNPDLRNISGPFDRAYGMDMTSYISVVGIALRTVLPENLAPLPDLSRLPIDHLEDLWFAPQFSILRVDIPPDAMQSFLHFRKDHLVRRRITDKRIATAWIASNQMYGGEITSKSKNIGLRSQFHAATIQWKNAEGKIDWIQLTRAPALDAEAGPGGLTISCKGSITFRIDAGQLKPNDIKKNAWSLPMLTLHIQTDAQSFSQIATGPFIEVTYSGMTYLKMQNAQTEKN